jgi:hypothetical protein
MWKSKELIKFFDDLCKSFFYCCRCCCDDDEESENILHSIFSALVTTILVFNVISPPISYLWNIVSLVMYSDLYNFSKSAQFIANYTQIPQPSWHTVAQCSPIPKAELFNCLVSSKEVRVADIFFRTLGVLLPFVFLVGLLYRLYWPKDLTDENNNDVELGIFGEEIQWESQCQCYQCLMSVQREYCQCYWCLDARR